MLVAFADRSNYCCFARAANVTEADLQIKATIVKEKSIWVASSDRDVMDAARSESEKVASWSRAEFTQTFGE